MDLLAISCKLKPVRGQRLAAWMSRFLTATPGQLSKWSGNFTEVTTAKVVEILRRRGVVEEHEARTEEFAILVNACYRATAQKAEG